MAFCQSIINKYPNMGPKMSLKHTNSWVGLWAIFVGTLKWLIPSVDCHVRSEVTKSNEASFAIFPIARKWSFSSLHFKKFFT